MTIAFNLVIPAKRPPPKPSPACGGGKGGDLQVVRLLVESRAVAAIVTLRSGAAAWVWKIAYDECFARFSPGVQVLLDITEGFAA